MGRSYTRTPEPPDGGVADHRVPGPDDVGDSCLHPTNPRTGKRDGQLVVGLKEMAQEHHRMVHDRQVVRIQVAQDRTGHGTEDTRMQVAWTRPEQDAGIVPQFEGGWVGFGRHG